MPRRTSSGAFTVSPRSARLMARWAACRGWAGPRLNKRVRALINALAAVLTVIAVLLLRAVLKLAILPFRALRSLWRRQTAPA